MPKTTINYTKAVIYKIQHQDKPELLYIGSTTDFIRRKHCHKERCNDTHNKLHNLKIYKMIRDNDGWDSFKMIIIKEFPCQSKVELLIEEDKMMQEMKSSLNDKKSFGIDTKRHKENKKVYYQNNKEEFKKKDEPTTKERE